MNVDRTKPIPVKGPEASPSIFFVRQLFDLQLKTIAGYLRPLLPMLKGKVLDIGAGEGPWRYFLNKSAVYQGVDIRSADQFGMSEQKDVVYYDGMLLPFPDGTFDAAICIEVLEHASEPALLLSEAYRVLKPGAPFALTVPWSARTHHIPFDFHRFTRYQLDAMLAKAGFIDVRIYERGNDICAVANKLIVIAWRLLMPSRKLHFLWTLPLAILDLCVASVFLMCAHISLYFGLGSKDDPLGYFVECTRA
ncbi:class I SAM-dependent methyltransferase [Bordetella sp. LUAb4]|uniref:class I SAM-dependent methyltransferase n=1 Tax=Bordetella sp. LUAb4 TaxID=2843195 RepID=UPI001E632929|nr:class I SAM-dependent methyltransferase [Bordetella sp. LUAb4]